jgi:4-hydroxyphenylacetate 3-monooxygenase
VWIDGERVDDVPSHPAFKPMVDARARIYDLAHEQATREGMSYVDSETGERCPVGAKRLVTDQAPSTISALPAVLEAAGSDIEV